MLVTTLDGINYELMIPTKIARGNKRKTSKGHATAKRMLHDIFPTMGIYEELPVLVEGNKQLYFDFFIPTLNLAVEVHGSQHYHFSRKFHKSKIDLLKAMVNDATKSQFCEINNITLIVLPYDEEKNWESLLTNYQKQPNI